MTRFVGQTLHGYEDGHVLLASSVTLDDASTDLMLLMSDLAPKGPVSAGGWLTGYPLPSNDAYVISRTWPAPEMPRPGCVWTHSLIFDYPTLGSRRSFSTVVAHLKRPAGDLRSYGRKLTLPADRSADRLSRRLYPPARSALMELYGEAGTAVLSCSSDEEAEALALALFEQQWPRLRRRLRWATAAMASSTAIPEFDFVISRDVGSARRGSAEASRQGWIVGALADLRVGGSDFRRRLRELAIDVTQGRRAFPFLASTVLLADAANTTADEICRLLTLFEEKLPEEGALAKSQLLAAYVATGVPLTPALLKVARNLLPELSPNGPEAAAFVSACWRSERNLFWTGVAQAYPEAARQALRVVSPTELVASLASSPEHLPPLLELRPDVSVAPEAWAALPERKADLLAFARHDQELIYRGVRTALETSDLAAAAALVSDGSTDAMFEALLSSLEVRGAKVSSLTDFERDWLHAAARDLNAALRYLERQAGSNLVFIELARLLGPASFKPQAFASDVWFEAWNRSRGAFPEADAEFVAAFFLMRSCQFETDRRAEVFAASANSMLIGVERGLVDPQARRFAQDLSIFNIFNPFESRYRAFVRGLATWVAVQSVPIGAFVAEAKARFAEDLLDELRWREGGQAVIHDALSAGRRLSKRRRELLQKSLR